MTNSPGGCGCADNSSSSCNSCSLVEPSQVDCAVVPSLRLCRLRDPQESKKSRAGLVAHRYLISPPITSYAMRSERIRNRKCVRSRRRHGQVVPQTSARCSVDRIDVPCRLQPTPHWAKDYTRALVIRQATRAQPSDSPQSLHSSLDLEHILTYPVSTFNLDRLSHARSYKASIAPSSMSCKLLACNASRIVFAPAK
jgi:hypothetical protein